MEGPEKGIILYMRPAHARRGYSVSLIGEANT